ncbi:MAG: hypothetical protein HQL59_07125, partial [Magnetococcales bacterium]|nr:hypothetical protein [Magnetococcales bacterium]
GIPRITAAGEGGVDEPEGLGRALAEELRLLGAERILAELRDTGAGADAN